MRDLSARAGFRDAERPAGCLEKAAYGGLQGIVLIGVNLVAQQFLQAADLLFYAGFLLFPVPTVDGQA